LISTVAMEAKKKSVHILDCLARRGRDYPKRREILPVAEGSLLDCHRKLEGWMQRREEAEFVTT